MPGLQRTVVTDFAATSAAELSTDGKRTAIKAAVMRKLNPRAKDLAATVLIALVIGLLAAFTLGYTPDQGEEITITNCNPAFFRGQLNRP